LATIATTTTQNQTPPSYPTSIITNHKPLAIKINHPTTMTSKKNNYTNHLLPPATQKLTITKTRRSASNTSSEQPSLTITNKISTTTKYF
jgi:hypothetical protein